MMFLSYIWLNRPYSYDWESNIVQINNIVKNIILGLEDKPSKDSLLFVNVSYDKMLIPRYDTDGFESGKIAITDRAALIKFLGTINESPNYKFIILDIFFEDSTSLDSILQVQVKKSRNLILPYHLDGGETTLTNRIHGWNGLADYDSDFGTFLKYTYLQKDTFSTVPLMLYQKFNKGYINKSGPFYTSQGHLALDAVTLDFPVRKYNVFTNDSLGYNSVHLCDLATLPPAFIKELTKNKIIVIGDFLDRDIHPTPYGDMAGPLIQLNAYLALANGDHLLTWPLLIFIFINYLIISWFLFSQNVFFTNKWLEKMKASRIGSIIYDFIKYAFFLILINIFGYLLFDVHLNVLIIGIYIVAIEYIIIWINSISDKKVNKI
jgi:hypothetical protein